MNKQKYLNYKTILKTSLVLFSSVLIGFSQRTFAGENKNNDISFCPRFTGVDIHHNFNLSQLNRDLISKVLDSKKEIQERLKATQKAVSENQYDVVMAQFGESLKDIDEVVKKLPANSDEALLQFQSYVFSKIKESLMNIHSELEYKLRVAILPALVCESLDDDPKHSNFEQIYGDLSQQLQSDYLIGDFKNQSYSNDTIVSGVSLSRGYYTTGRFQKGFDLVALNLNIERKRDRETGVLITNISGGAVLNLPQTFSSPLRKSVEIETALKTLKIKVQDVIVDNKPHTNHFAAMTFKDLKFNEDKLYFNDAEKHNPKIDIFFTNRIFAVPRLGDTFIHFVPKFDDKEAGLLVRLSPELCSDNCFLQNWYQKHIKLNVVLNHLVMDLVPTKLTIDSQIYVPFIRLPHIKSFEEGGAGALIRYFKNGDNYLDTVQNAFFPYNGSVLESDYSDSIPKYKLYIGSDSNKDLNNQLVKGLLEKNLQIRTGFFGAISLGKNIVEEITLFNQKISTCESGDFSSISYQDCIEKNLPEYSALLKKAKEDNGQTATVFTF